MNPPHIDQLKRWHLDQARVAAWRVWDGEAVLYDDLSGDTLRLDVIMTEIFTRLCRSDATAVDLVQHLAEALDIEPDLRLQRLVEIAIERFADSGLVAADALRAHPASPL